MAAGGGGGSASGGGGGGSSSGAVAGTVAGTSTIRGGGRWRGQKYLLKPVNYILQLIVRVLILIIF